MEYPYFTLMFDINKLKDLSSEDVSFCQNCVKDTKVKPIILPILKVGHLNQ